MPDFKLDITVRTELHVDPGELAPHVEALLEDGGIETVTHTTDRLDVVHPNISSTSDTNNDDVDPEGIMSQSEYNYFRQRTPTRS